MSPHVGFVLEQTLGHVTHADNLRRLIPSNPAIDATFLPVEFPVDGWSARIPGYGNWTVRAGIRARRALRDAARERRFDALFVHTQVPAVLIPDTLRRVPTVVSLDATPQQYDELGEHYSHGTAPEPVERLKWRANRACFQRAAHLVAWSQWTKDALIDDYGIAAERITVIAPGVDPAAWTPSSPRRRTPRAPIRVLFVGGDLQRKGGIDLLHAFRPLRDDRALPPVELHLVTSASPPPEEGVTVHHGLRPNSPELIELYHQSDIFCLPTLGDCLPMVLSEAGAAHLPAISTDVGAIAEIVTPESGFVVAPGDVSALTAALRRLVADDDLRTRLGERASQIVAERFDAAKNAATLVDVLVEVSGRGRR